jgi:glycosyltransferase involved in cell wall biosynthesis
MSLDKQLNSDLFRQMISTIPLVDAEKLYGGCRTKMAVTRDFLVSVICVTRNASATLPALLNSIQLQKDHQWEFIVVDGASDDGTLDILRNNEHIIDYWVSRPDKGIYDAMNRALDYARGQWVIFFGADDLLLDGFNDALDRLNHPYTIYYGNLLYYGKPFSRVYDDYYLTKLNFCQQAIFYPMSVFERYRFDLRYLVYADYHLNLRCWKDPQFNFEHIDRTVSYFSDGGFSSFGKDKVWENERDTLFKDHLKPSSYYRYLNRTIGFPRMLLRLVRNK